MPKEPTTRASQTVKGTPDVGGPVKGGRDLAEPGTPSQMFEGQPHFAPNAARAITPPATPAAKQNTAAPDIKGKPDKV